MAARGWPKNHSCDNTVPVSGLPECFSLEDLDVVQMSHPRDQGACGGCTAFSFISTMEISLLWRYRDALQDLADQAVITFPFDLDLSEWQLVLLSLPSITSHEEPVRWLCSEGSELTDYLNIAENTGTVSEQFLQFPEGFHVFQRDGHTSYPSLREASDLDETTAIPWARAMNTPYPEANMGTSGIPAFKVAPSSLQQVRSIQQVKQALVQGQAVTTVIHAMGSSLLSCLDDSEGEVGPANHAVTIVGYWDNHPDFSSAGGAWLIRNSWGEPAPVWFPYTSIHHDGNGLGPCLLGRKFANSTSVDPAFVLEAYVDSTDPDHPNLDDNDFDGVPDWVDNCSLDANASQQDFDGDGVGDICDPDRDGDGFRRPYDCDDHAPFIWLDRDRDSVCDEVAPMPYLFGDIPYNDTGTRQCSDCQNCCAAMATYWSTQMGFSYCEPCCRLRCQQTDNCMSTEFCRNVSRLAVPGTKLTSIPPDYDPVAAEARCSGVEYNLYQHDSDNNGVGDRCQTEYVPSAPQLGTPYQSVFGQTLGPAQSAITACTTTTTSVHFNAEGRFPTWPPLSQEPKQSKANTVGVCPCRTGTEWDSECKYFDCPESGEYGLNHPYAKAYQPIHADECEALGELPDVWSSPDTTWMYGSRFIWEGGPPTYRECKYRPILFNHVPSENYFSATFDWQQHHWSLAGRATLARIAYPEPEVQGMNCHSSEGALTCDYYAIVSFPEIVPADKRVFSNITAMPAGGSTGCLTVPLDLNLADPALNMRIIDPGPLRPQAGGWVILGDPVVGDVAVLTLDPERLVPAQVARMSFDPRDGHPDLESAAFTAATMDRGLVGQGSGFGPLIFAMGSTDQAGYSDQRLWVGEIGGADSPWKPLASSPLGSDGWIERPNLVAEPKAGRVLVLAETIGLGAGGPSPGDDAPPVTHPEQLEHVLFAFDLNTAAWSTLGSLQLPTGLRGYSVAHDARRRRLIVGGGVAGSETNEAIYSVSLVDLQVRSLRAALPDGQGRERPTLALTPDGRSLLVFGGERRGLVLSDLWRVDLVAGTGTLVSQEVPGARPGYVGVSRSGREVALLDDTGFTDPAVRLVTVELSTGQLSGKRLLDLSPLEPGRFRGRVRSGASQAYPVVIPATAPYPGRPTVAVLAADGPGLELVVTDSQGAVIAHDDRSAPELSAAWLGQPGERYLILIRPAAGYAPGSEVGFEVTVSEGSMSQDGEYSAVRPVERLVVEGDRVWLSGWWGIQAVRLEQTGSPQLLDEKRVPGVARGLALAGDRACVARTMRRRGLWCLDAGDPSKLRWRGPPALTVGMGRGIAAVGEIGYVAEGVRGVGVYHLTPSDPPRVPEPLGRVEPGGMAIHVAVHGERMFVARMDGAVRIYDLRDPVHPELLGQVQAGGPVVGIGVHGATAHLHRLDVNGTIDCMLGLRCPRGSTVEVFDVAEPAVPVKIGEYDAQSSLPFAFIRSNRARLLVPSGNGFEVLRVSPLEATP